jgi:FKBP-type peptidyl-prolyl cis-trans isomerase FkpA
MKMIKPTNALIGLLMLSMACSNSAKEEKTPNGFTFNVVEKGDGIVPKANQLLVFDYVIKDSKDSVWMDTYDSGMPGVVGIQDSAAMPTEIGMIQMFRMLSVPDSVTVTKGAKDFFKDVLGQPLPPKVDSTMTMTVALRVRSVMDMQKFGEFQQELMQKREGKQKAKDEKTITDYLSSNNIKAEKDTAGIHYVIYNNAGGKKPAVENCVEVKYHGKFLKDGKTFDKNDNIAFSLQQVIRGWTLSIPKLGIGDSATFYIPSTLAYGPRGIPGAIPPDAILVFDVTLLNVKDTFDPTTRGCK